MYLESYEISLISELLHLVSSSLFSAQHSVSQLFSPVVPKEGIPILFDSMKTMYRTLDVWQWLHQRQRSLLNSSSVMKSESQSKVDFLILSSSLNDSFSSSGSYHLLRLLFDDYIFYLIEYVHMDSLIGEFLAKIPQDELLALDSLDSFFPGKIVFIAFMFDVSSIFLL